MLDAHCHIDQYSEIARVVEACTARAVFTIAVTGLPSAFLACRAALGQRRSIRIALGLHPLSADAHQRELPMFAELINTTPFVGEVGLDFSAHGSDSREQQIESFRRVAKLVSAKPKLMSIHSRAAESAVLEILQEFQIGIAVFHWYSGSIKTLDQAVAAGHMFSINPAMLTSARGRNVIAHIPTERVLTESDGPYVHIGGKVAHPWDVALVERYLANAWRVDTMEARRCIWRNFRQMLGKLRLLSGESTEPKSGYMPTPDYP